MRSPPTRRRRAREPAPPEMSPQPALSSDAASSRRDIERELHAFCARHYSDPLGFVLHAYPWPINGEPGPDTWQCEVLAEIGCQVRERKYDGVTSVLPIRVAISSGHGTGKTALFAFLVDWIMSTRRNAHGTVTAGTNEQLQNKTWARIREWTARCMTRRWFEINSTVMYRKGFRATWFCTPQSCAPENSEAFAGQHAKGSTSFYIVDEGPAVVGTVWDVMEGGLTDEPMIFVGGNPTQNTGRFYEICHGRSRDLWHPRIIDARTCRLPNHALIAQWLELHGEDSDFVRVRVRGLPPRASSLQFIDQDRVYAAQRRAQVVVLPDEPLVCGMDVSGGGSAFNVVRFRRGADARTIPPIRVPGTDTKEDRSAFLAVLATVLRDRTPERRVTQMFVDAAYGAPYVERLSAMGFRNVQEVSFGSTVTPHKALKPTPRDVPDLVPFNMRAYMWQKMKDWLATAAIDPKDDRLAADLVGPGFHLTKKDELVLEAKASMQERGVASPDDGDALALTWAAPVLQGWKTAAQTRRGRFAERAGSSDGGRLGWLK